MILTAQDQAWIMLIGVSNLKISHIGHYPPPGPRIWINCSKSIQYDLLLRGRKQQRGRCKGRRRRIPFPSPSFFLRSVIFAIYTTVKVNIFLSADKPRNRRGASLIGDRRSSIKIYSPWNRTNLCTSVFNPFLLTSICIEQHLVTTSSNTSLSRDNMV